ncbi:MAG: ABC transporter permease [Betaproteobacteria bacterium HGW-Betaproteobacteria-7]|jgi:phospholipid/cholesterol/gamma-HCH transport system permease protein|nr:MAG: ABC transporter permease [Betaproteobacteria bacterium HGW-Betaproteobacteria-7]
MRSQRWLKRQGRLAGFSALSVVAALSPASYDRITGRGLAGMLCLGAWQMLPGYLLASILISTVLTRIVAVTAASYGLSHLALEAIVRVLVLELIPLAAALFVALRVAPVTMQRLGRPAGDPPPAYRDLIPYTVGSAGAVIVLAVLSGISALAVAYLVVHGISQWALADYARLIGQVFDPTMAAVFSIKLMLFAVVVGIAPTTVALDAGPLDPVVRQMRVMARLLLMLMVIEATLLILPRL